jgi:hypothetical protein
MRLHALAHAVRRPRRGIRRSPWGLSARRSRNVGRERDCDRETNKNGARSEHDCQFRCFQLDRLDTEKATPLRLKYCPAKSHVLYGVYHPERLMIMRICQRASGTVRKVILEEDGDLHIRVHLTATYVALTNDVNDAKQHGDLVVEFMPRDGGHLPRPAVGDFVTLVGAWVTDLEHGCSSCTAEGWNELHPVWREILNGEVFTSGPKNGGSPASAHSKNAADLLP